MADSDKDTRRLLELIKRHQAGLAKAQAALASKK